MQACKQTQTQSVLEHGQSVWLHTMKLISGQFDGFKLPDEFIMHHRYIVNNLHTMKQVKEYNQYHDCGKPLCIEIDAEGKRHFPDHANVSAMTYNQHFNDHIVSQLIRQDMDLHISTAEEIEAKNWDIRTAFTLLITAFAELHSNAAMFGGTETVSFKSKYKKLERRCNQLLKKYAESSEHPYSYVIVRNDLPNRAKVVQGTHAAMEMARKMNTTYHPSVIYVVVKDEKKLKSVMEKLIDYGINCSIFREPMEPLNDSITAIATEPLYDDQREYLKRFTLLNV